MSKEYTELIIEEGELRRLILEIADREGVRKPPIKFGRIKLYIGMRCDKDTIKAKV